MSLPVSLGGPPLFCLGLTGCSRPVPAGFRHPLARRSPREGSGHLSSPTRRSTRYRDAIRLAPGPGPRPRVLAACVHHSASRRAAATTVAVEAAPAVAGSRVHPLAVRRRILSPVRRTSPPVRWHVRPPVRRHIRRLRRSPHVAYQNTPPPGQARAREPPGRQSVTGVATPRRARLRCYRSRPCWGICVSSRCGPDPTGSRTVTRRPPGASWPSPYVCWRMRWPRSGPGPGWLPGPPRQRRCR